ncbi:MAG: carboxypeptidase-like regulatory domain-containing protein [Bryobacteraceae bacterium]
MIRLLAVCLFLLASGWLAAVEHRGSVRAADQWIPGATVTARQGDKKVVAYTDESGQYRLDLAPGTWDIEISMFGFSPVHGQVEVGSDTTYRDWTLTMPWYAGTQPAQSSKPAASASNTNLNRQRGQGRGGYGRGGRGQFGQPGQPGQPQQGPNFQSLSMNATEQGQQDTASGETAGQTAGDAADADANDSFLVVGSTSGGLAAASDEQARANRMAGRGGPGGPGGPALGAQSDVAFNGLPVQGAGDSLGLGGFGAAGINGGFGPGAGPGGGGFGPGGGGGGGRGGGGFGGGGRGGRGGGGGGFGGRGGARGNRAPFNGQYAGFGNRRRAQPAYTGSVAVTVTNSALNAAPFSLNGENQPKPSSARESVAFNIGGPLRIPKIYSGNNWTVYLTVQGTRARSAQSSVATVPTSAERDGDFSGLTLRNQPIAIYDPLSSAPFPNNIIPTTRINPAAAGLLQYFPQPLYTGIVQNYDIDPSNPSATNVVGFRIGGPISSKDRLSFNEQYSGNSSTSEQLFGFKDTGSGYGVSSTTQWAHSFRPRLNNTVNVAFSRSISNLTPYFAYKTNVAAALEIAGPDQSPLDWGPPSLSFTNFGSLSDSSASQSRSQTVNVTDALTYTVQRRHNLQFGFGYRRLQQNPISYANARGAFSFSGALTSGYDANGNILPNTGFDFADFLLGLPQTSSLLIKDSYADYYRGWATNAYAQDDWRVRPNLSIDIGLRYEYFAPYTELRGHLANLDANGNLTAVDVVTPGVRGQYSGAFPTSLVNGDPDLLSPRLGLAWRPSTKHSRVVRVGYSIFYSGSAYGSIAAKMAAQPPWATTGTLSTSLTNPLTLENGFDLTPTGVTNTYAIDKNYKPAYAQTWVVALQQTLPSNTLIEFEYLGTKGTRLDEQFAPNEAAPGTPAALVAQQLRVPGAGAFSYETDNGNSIYHAGQIRLTRRFSRGMSAMALYTRAKSIDDASTFSGGAGGTVVQNFNDLSAERGLSSFDQRNHLTLNYLLSSPVGIHGLWRNGDWKTKAFAGWTYSGGFTFSSGTPHTALISGNLASTSGIAALEQLRAEATGTSIDAPGSPYFNLAAFTTPPPGTFGDAARDTIPGLPVISLNGALNRAWRFGDVGRRQLQLRLSANNMLNHVQITGFGTTVNSNNYGLATAASSTRTVTLLLRFNF